MSDGADRIDEDAQSTQPRGLRNGFGAYETVRKDDYSRLLKAGLVIFDTNALLNLYRYTPQARTDFLAAMKEIQSQIWIPHQVVVELWRNRESAITDFDEATKQATAAFWKAYETQVQALNTWGNRVSISAAHRETLEAALKGAVERVAKEMQDLRDVDQGVAVDTESDPVLVELEPLLLGRIGSPLSPDAHKAAILEGNRRIVDQVPPGYEDAKKPEDRRIGDYLLWEQILVQVERDGVDVLLVTGDAKPDWWRLDDKKRPKGPRVELYEEMRQRSGRKLRMLAPRAFLDHMKDIFDLPVQPESLIDVQQVNQPEVVTIFSSDTPGERTEKFRRRLVELYRHYLKAKGFFVTASRGSDYYPSDLHVTRSVGDPVFIVYAVRVVSNDWDDVDGLRHMLRDTAPASENSVQVILFPSQPTSGELDIVERMNVVAVWNILGKWVGNTPAIIAGLVD